MLKFFFILTSLFLFSSCHQIGKKRCCKHNHSYFKKIKDCCGNKKATAFSYIQSMKDQKIKGEVILKRVTKRQIQITAKINGLKANQKFGFHIHEFGNCKKDGLMAGSHFNPFNQKHGDPKKETNHLGDLGNLISNNKGQANDSVTIKGNLKNLFGRSMIIHASPDDLISQPTGNSGPRIACGVIVR